MFSIPIALSNDGESQLRAGNFVGRAPVNLRLFTAVLNTHSFYKVFTAVVMSAEA